MDTGSSPEWALISENTELRARLEEAEETLGAIREGEVDALVVHGAEGARVYTLESQDAETNRLRGEMLAQVSDAVIAVDEDERISYLNAAAERLYGLPASRALGRTLSMVYEARWTRPDGEAAARSALDKHGEWRGESVHVRHDGREVNVESSITVLRDRGGRPSGWLAVIRDVTERKRHEERVLVSEIRYRRLFEAAHDGVLVLDPATRGIIDANPFMTRMLGYSHAELVGKELFEIGVLKDQAASREMVARLLRDHQARYDDLRLESREGRLHDVEVVANLYDENGRPIIQCNVRDITERRRSEEHVRLLMAEVNHRAKNLLAVVQAVAFQTARTGDPVTVADRLSDRIGGLAAGQDLLVKSQWQGVEVSDLVEAQLAHFRELIGTRVLIEGPPARLRAEAAQGIGMALHELATNAVKHGALSNGQGRVLVAWRVVVDNRPAFSMSWVEEGGPAVVAPLRRGFGQTVIGRMAEASVQGEATITYGEGGLGWTLSASLENTLTRDDLEA